MSHCITQLCEKNLYDNIIDCVIAKLIWKKIKQICELKNFNVFLIIYVKYEIFKCLNCKTFYQYNVKFREIDNELVISRKNSIEIQLIDFQIFCWFVKINCFFHRSMNCWTWFNQQWNKNWFQKEWRCCFHARLRISMC